MEVLQCVLAIYFTRIVRNSLLSENSSPAPTPSRPRNDFARGILQTPSIICKAHALMCEPAPLPTRVSIGTAAAHKGHSLALHEES